MKHVLWYSKCTCRWKFCIDKYLRRNLNGNFRNNCNFTMIIQEKKIIIIEFVN